MHESLPAQPWQSLGGRLAATVVLWGFFASRALYDGFTIDGVIPLDRADLRFERTITEKVQVFAGGVPGRAEFAG